MTYKIEQIEGIGPVFAEQLNRVGIFVSDDLLRLCATDTMREDIARRAGISALQLTTWFHQADLMRVRGVGAEFGQLLEASGIESVETLSDRKPENVVNLLHRVNTEKKLTRLVPSIKTVAKWVQHAREMVGVAPAPPAQPAEQTSVSWSSTPVHSG